MIREDCGSSRTPIPTTVFMVPQASQKEGIPLKTLFADLWASLQIFYSNFTARFGRLFNAGIVLGILALCLYALLRALLAGRKGRRSPSPLTTHKPDPQVTRHAAESLAMAIRIPVSPVTRHKFVP